MPGLLRVAVDATPLYDARTGVGRFTEELLRGVAGRTDLDIVGYAVTLRGSARLEQLLPPGIRPARRRPMAAAPLRAAWRRLDHPRIERWTGPVDVVHGSNFVVPPSRAAQVASVHDLTFIHYPEFCTPDVLQYPGLVRRAIARGAWIHCDSEFVRQEVIDLVGADPARVVAVPLGVTPPPSADGERGRSLAGGNPYVLAVGTIEPRKNLPTLLRAFEAVAGEEPELRLVVAGPDGWGLAAYEDALGSTTHRDRVVRVGFVSEVDRGDLIAGASVVAVPSHYEGFGLTAAEAMLAGTPVVASDAGSHPEVVGDAGLLVAPTDVSGLAEAIHAVLTDDELAAGLRSRGRARARAYTWQATAQKIIDLWRQAAAAQGSSRARR